MAAIDVSGLSANDFTVELSQEEATAAISKRVPERRSLEKETERRMGNEIESLYNKMRRRG